MNNSQKVLSQNGLQYFYNQISGRFAKAADVTDLNSSLANHIDSATASINSLTSSVNSLTTWKTNSFSTTTINGSSKALFSGAVEYLKTVESGNATYNMMGYSIGKPYYLSDFSYTRADGKVSVKLGSSSRTGELTFTNKSGGNAVLSAASTGNSYLYFPVGGTSSAPAALALSSEVVAVSNSLDNAKKDISALQTTVGGHTSSISSLTTTVNAIPNTYATKASLTTEINKVLNGVNAELLDGLNEVIASLNGDKDFYSTMQSLLNEKATKAELTSTVESAVDTINDALADKASTSVVTTAANGIVPKSDAAKGTISSSTADWVFTNKNGTIGWYKLPANAFKDTVYTLPAAGSALGGVKTGGNVTISDGVITVNNDGHTHTVANVTNLSNLLDEKITASAVTFTTDGSGKAITNVTFNPTSKVFTLTKDEIYSNATTSAAGLMSSTDKTKLNNTNIAYATCSTEATTAAKVATVSGNTNWTLAAGSVVSIFFSNTNTASNPTLNVNSTGAKNIYFGATRITTSNLSYAGYTNRVLTFMYDGTQYRFISWGYDTNNYVTQTVRTTNGEFPMLLRGTAAGTTTTTTSTTFATAITANPSTGTITATKFAGDGSGLTALSAANISAGTLAVARGGTGVTSNPSMLINLGSTTAASVFASSPRPGVTGTLAVTNGGTGATNAKAALTNLGIYYGSTAPSSPQEGMIWLQP